MRLLGRLLELVVDVPGLGDFVESWIEVSLGAALELTPGDSELADIFELVPEFGTELLRSGFEEFAGEPIEPTDSTLAEVVEAVDEDISAAVSSDAIVQVPTLIGT